MSEDKKHLIRKKFKEIEWEEKYQQLPWSKRYEETWTGKIDCGFLHTHRGAILIWQNTFSKKFHYKIFCEKAEAESSIALSTFQKAKEVACEAYINCIEFYQ